MEQEGMKPAAPVLCSWKARPAEGAGQAGVTPAAWRKSRRAALSLRFINFDQVAKHFLLSNFLTSITRFSFL